MINFEQKLPFRVHITQPNYTGSWDDLRSLIYNNRFYGLGNGLFKLYSPNDRLLPFQAFIPIAEGATIDDDPQDWYLFDCNGNLLADLDVTQLTVKPVHGEGMYIIYNGDNPMPIIEPHLANGGVYYFVMVMGYNRFVVSEYFYVPCAESEWKNLLKIEYWNSCDIANVIYQTGYKNILYLNTTLFENTPTIEETGFENGFGEFVQTAARYLDNYRINDVVPEFLLQAMLFMQLHNNVEITVPETKQKGKFKVRKVTPTWQTGAFLCDVVIELEQEQLLWKGGCCDNKKFSSLIPLQAVNNSFMINSSLYAAMTALPNNANILTNDLGDYTKKVTAGTFATSLGGQVILQQNGFFSYRKPVGVGAQFVDTFVYTLTDNWGSSDTATVTLRGGTLNGVADKYYNQEGNDELHPIVTVIANDFIPVTHYGIVFPFIEVPSGTDMGNNIWRQYDANGSGNTMYLNIVTGAVYFYNDANKQFGASPDVFSYRLRTNASGGLTAPIAVNVFYE